MRIDEQLARIGWASQTQTRAASQGEGASTGDFDRLLSRELEKNASLTFSKHAGQRLSERDIELGEEELRRLSGAVKRAEEKGVRNTLVLLDRNAFIVNVPTGTVITAMSGSAENVFTQIDGAVIA